MDLLAAVLDGVSILLLASSLFLARKAMLGFKQSKQALKESADFVAAIVSAVSSRIEDSDSAVEAIRSKLEDVVRQNVELERRQTDLSSNCVQMLDRVEDVLAKEEKLEFAVGKLKTSVISPPQNRTPESYPPAKPHDVLMEVSQAAALARLTPTEHQALEILSQGPKPAPELGRLLGKSREHMARLMKKLYLEGYIDRESNHTPFRYRLNASILSALEAADADTIGKRLEKT